MNFFTALVAIAAIVSVAGVIGSVLTARYRAHAGLRKDWMGNEVPIEREDDGTSAALLQEVTELRERVKVLERIATDDRHPRAIAQEIESLRDR